MTSKLVAEGPSIVVHNSEAQLETLSDWSRDTFTKSGLLDRVRASEIGLAEAERQTLAFVEEHCPKNRAPLCGNSIHTDRAFLYARHAHAARPPALPQRDVSSFKEVLRRWYPKAYAPPKKAGLHEALTDIRESIDELRYYREAFLRPDVQAGEGSTEA